MTKTQIPKTQNLKLGVFYGIISSFSFAMMSVFVKKIGDALPTSMLIFFRFGISLILLLPLIVIDQNFTFKIQEPMRYFLRILASLSALFLVFYVIKFIPLVDALLLNNTAPLFVPVISLFLTGAKTPRDAWIGIILGFIGVVVIMRPGQEIFSLMSMIALISGFLAAFSIVQIRLISKTSSTNQILFYYFLISTLLSVPVILLQWQSPSSFENWLLLLAIGIFGTLYQVFSTLSYSVSSVRLVSSLFFLIVVFGGFFDWLFWNQVPDFSTLVGASLVIIGTIITVYFGQKAILKK